MIMQVRIADYVSLLSALSPREVLCQHRATALDADSTARLLDKAKIWIHCHTIGDYSLIESLD